MTMLKTILGEFDSVTPNEYEPPGFMAAENDNFAFGDEPMTLNVGDVATVSTAKIPLH